MKLTRNKWLNFAILKIAEGLGVVFIPYLVGSIHLIIWLELRQEHCWNSVFNIWFAGMLLIFVPIFVVGFACAIVYINLEYAEKLRPEKWHIQDKTVKKVKK